MTQRKKLQFLLLGLTITLSVLSCKKLIFREVQCREPNNTNHLKWFAGKLNDTITLVKPDNTIINFIVDDKYIFHRTQYTSDTGCGCHDMWGIRMVSGSDTISMYNQEKYVEDNESNGYSACQLTINGIYSGFISEDKSSLSSMIVNDTTITNLIRFKYENNDEGQFTEIYISENIGIVQMVSANGDKWVNQDLTSSLDVSLGSFSYEENTCE